MTDSVENRVLEHLRHIHGRVDQLADDVAQLKHRMTSLEGAMTLVKREIAYGDEPDARQ
ncbi:MAG: hypothetical protein MUC53_12485 [Candidatus Contendobacter sp.]|jgi:hypothetical protein|nr:hypothetical protein [Candidatus Contendobacter sp.]